MRVPSTVKFEDYLEAIRPLCKLLGVEASDVYEGSINADNEGISLTTHCPVELLTGVVSDTEQIATLPDDTPYVSGNLHEAHAELALVHRIQWQHVADRRAAAGAAAAETA